MKKNTSRATIKVCVHKDCCQKGSEQVYDNLKSGLAPEEALILKVDDCMSLCALGPNIALNDNIVYGVKPFTAIEQVKAELANPSCKADGLGSKPLETLDALLDDIEKL